MPPDLGIAFDSATQAIFVWICLALAAILILLRQPRTLILNSDKNGRLSISQTALNRLIEACCEQIDGIAVARATVRRRSGKFHTDIRLKIRPDAKVDAIQGYLAQEITAIYRENLGLTDIGNIDVRVVGIAPAASPF